jgi:presenilin-like A22 family membrane protease
VSGLYTADLLNPEDISSTFKVSITLFDVYKGVVVGKTIDMFDTQPANEVMHVQTPLWCINPEAGEVYWIHTVASAQKNTGEIWFALDEWVRINLTVDMLKGP